jgi:hypothetical protein|tara:strand:- start:1270 stop:1542 length:273 start_codon:yes stop_codon:yes gene_type:complete
MFTIDNEKAIEDAISIMRLMANSSYKNALHLCFLNKRMHDLFKEASKKELADLIDDTSFKLNMHLHIDSDRELVAERRIKKRKGWREDDT